MNVQEALRRTRQVLAATINPAMMGRPDQTNGGASREENGLRAAPHIDRVRPDGSVDAVLLGQTKAVLELLITDRAILHVGRISDLPAETASRRELSNAIVQTVFDRLGTHRTVNEATLNAALAMFVDDVALVRRDAVDSGFVNRSPDGRSYELT